MSAARRCGASNVNVNLSSLPAHVLAGVSGGADSVALLLLLLERGGRVEAVHVNHGLRGSESDGDEAFVRALCRDKGVPLKVYRVDGVVASSEELCRLERYEFFRRAMAETGAQALVLAHHQDDQAETVLMHLMRGAGLAGMSGIAPDAVIDGIRVMRPLLGVPREELQDMLRERGQRWREDSSNRDTGYLRNYLRREVLPMLERRQTGAARHIAQTAALLREDMEALRGLAEAFLREHGGETWVAVEPLARQSAGLQRHILRVLWARQGLEEELSREQTLQLQDLLTRPVSMGCLLPRGWSAYRGWTHLHLLPGRPGPLEPPTPAADGATRHGVTLTLEPPDGTFGDGRVTQLVPEGWLEGCELRGVEPGDWIRPFGMDGTKEAGQYLMDRHVDMPFRRRLPALCRGREVLMIPGIGVGDVPRMKNHEGVMLRWRGAMPWKQDARKDGMHT